MALSYAGVPLIVHKPETIEAIEQNIPVEWVQEFQRQFWPGRNRQGWAFPGQSCPRGVHINRLYWPQGASRWAVGHFLVDEESLATIRQNRGTQGLPQPLVMTWMDETTEVLQTLTAQMTALPARPLFQFGVSNGLYLLTLVDDRYFWWGTSTGSIAVTAGTTTWANLYTAIASALQITINADPINAAYITPSTALTAYYEATPLMLDAVAYNVGQRIVVLPDGSVHALNVTTSQNTVQSQLNQFGSKRAGGIIPIYLGTQFTQDLANFLPASVTVTFPTTGTTNPGPWVETIELATLGIAGLTQGNGEKFFHDSAKADMSGGVMTPNNETELNGLAKQIATDWYLYQLGMLDIQYNGIVPWQPEGLSDSIEWSYRGGDSDAPLQGQLTTRIQRWTWNDQTEELAHESSDHTVPVTVMLPGAQFHNTITSPSVLSTGSQGGMTLATDINDGGFVLDGTNGAAVHLPDISSASRYAVSASAVIGIASPPNSSFKVRISIRTCVDISGNSVAMGTNYILSNQAEDGTSPDFLSLGGPALMVNCAGVISGVADIGFGIVVCFEDSIVTSSISAGNLIFALQRIR